MESRTPLIFFFRCDLLRPPHQYSPMNYSWKHSVLNIWIHQPFHHASEWFRFHSPAVGAEHLLIILSEKTLFTALPGLTSFKTESMPFAFIFSFFEFPSQCEYLWCVPQYLFVGLWKTRDIIRCSLHLKLWLLLGREPTVWGASQKTDLDGFHTGDS